MSLRSISVASALLAGPGCSGTGPSADTPAAAQAVELEKLSPGPAKPAGTVAERVEKARQLAGVGELPKAIEALEEGMAIDSNDRTSLGLLARYQKDRARAVEDAGTAEYYTRLVSSADYFRRLRQHYPELTDEGKALGLEVFFDEATAHAKSRRIEETTGSLRDLIGAGFRDFDRMRSDAGWKEILEIPQFRKEFDAITGAKPAS